MTDEQCGVNREPISMTVSLPKASMPLPKSPLPKSSMPREKLLSHGPQALTDAELVAIFLRTGTQERNVIALSDYLLAEFGSLRGLFSADLEQFCAHKGLGVAKYVQLQAVLEMAKRYLSETLKRGDALTSRSKPSSISPVCCVTNSVKSSTCSFSITNIE